MKFRLLSFVFIVALHSACNSSESERLPAHDEQIVALDFVGGRISIPSNYVMVSNSTAHFDVPKNVEVFLQDSVSPEHQLLFTREDPLFLSKEAGEKFLKTHLVDLTKFYTQKNYVVKGIESKLLTTQKKRIIKLKLELSNDSSTSYLTHYIISDRTEAVSLYQFTNSKTDLERQVRNMVFEG